MQLKMLKYLNHSQHISVHQFIFLGHERGFEVPSQTLWVHFMVMRCETRSYRLVRVQGPRRFPSFCNARFLKAGMWQRPVYITGSGRTKDMATTKPENPWIGMSSQPLLRFIVHFLLQFCAMFHHETMSAEYPASKDGVASRNICHPQRYKLQKWLLGGLTWFNFKYPKKLLVNEDNSIS